jgi:alpha-D-ribose 1-methylphosphonate 5-triphosphate synthase subunit PhnG
MEQSARQEWMGVLARADANQLNAIYQTLEQVPPHDFLRPPEQGLVMVRGRAGGTGQPFNMGEMVITRCSVRLSDGHEGHAYVAGRDTKKAEQAAVLDGLLQDPAWQARIEQNVVAPLRQQEQEKRHQIRQKSAATKVDFFTMVRGDD